MAERKLPKVVPVCLNLQKSYACVKLGAHVDVLVLKRHYAHEGGVVSPYVGDVAPRTVAKCGVAIATMILLNWWMICKQRDPSYHVAYGGNEEVDADGGEYEEVQEWMEAYLPVSKPNSHIRLERETSSLLVQKQRCTEKQ